MKKVLMAIGIVVVVGACWRLSTANTQDLDPLKVAGDSHKLVFENSFVRVLEVHVPPGKIEPLHQHGRRVVIYLSDFHSRSTEKGGQVQERLNRSGSARWSEPIIHQVENIGKTEGHTIIVELK
jgi:hypothetical protein